MSTLVSVLINNYNYGRFIGEAIESVLNQTYQNIELIVVDDGSTDNSREIIHYYAQRNPEKIKVVYKENGGQSSAFNSGYNVAKGEIICFLDSDDKFLPTKIERVVQAHKSADIVEHSILYSNNTCKLLPSKEEAYTKLIQDSIFMTFAETSALSFKKVILDKFFPIPEENFKICAESYVVFLALYNTSKVISLKETLTYYRIHGENNWYGKGLSYFNFLRETINEWLKNNKLKTIYLGGDRIEWALDNLYLKNGYNYAVYGTGKYSEKVTELLLEKYHNIPFYIDSYRENTKKVFYNRSVIHVSDLNSEDLSYDYIIIASTYKESILENLNNINISSDKVIVLDI